MLKINKTLPRNKARCNSYTKVNDNSTYNDNSNYYNPITKRISYLTLATLICGIMPGLMGLSYYDSYSSKVYAAEGKALSDITTMQEITPNICNNTTVGVSTTLTDSRDGSTYNVARLSDGKCWMTQNLRLAGGTELKRTDTDLDPSIYTTDEQTYKLPATSSTFSNIKTIDNADNETYMNHQVYVAPNTTYGAYYSWCAATAGTCQISNSTNAAEKYSDIQPSTTSPYNTSNPTATTVVPAGGKATSSICPKGWRLPTGAEYTALKNNGTVKRGDFAGNSTSSGYWVGNGIDDGAGGVFFVAAGTLGASGATTLDSDGRYWSSTAASVTNVRNLGFDSSTTPYINSSARYFGFSVRCLADAKATEEVNVVAVKVPPVISIDAATGANVEVDPNVVSKDGTITATISANTTYDVLLSANKTALTLDNDEDSTLPNIPTTTESNPVQARTNAWGILNSDNTTYAGITTKPTNYYNTSVYNEEDQSTTHTFHLGVSVAPNLPVGEYSTTVTITAVNN